MYWSVVMPNVVSLLRLRGRLPFESGQARRARVEIPPKRLGRSDHGLPAAVGFDDHGSCFFHGSADVIDVITRLQSGYVRVRLRFRAIDRSVLIS